MQAVILAGGLGTRLKPITGSAPKPMVLILGSPFLEYQLRALRRYGIDDFIFCVGYGAQEIQSFFEDGARWGVRIRYVVESEPRGTAGALRGALDLVSESFFVLNGDTFAELDYGALVHFHHNHHADVTIALAPNSYPGAVGKIVLRADDAIDRFEEKADTEDALWTNAGVYFFERRVLDAIPANVAVSLEYDTFPHLIASGARVYGFVFRNYFIDIGTPETYHRFENDLMEGKAHVVSE